MRGGFAGLLAAIEHGIIDELDANTPDPPGVPHMSEKAQREYANRQHQRRKWIERRQRIRPVYLIAQAQDEMDCAP